MLPVCCQRCSWKSIIRLFSETFLGRAVNQMASATSVATKNDPKIERFMVAPTGIETESVDIGR